MVGYGSHYEDILKYFALAILFASSLSFAVGGSCPTGANYIDLASPATNGGLGSVTIPATHCYYVSAAGADTNSGIDEAHSWLHAPGMPACSNTCAATTLVAGDGVIFRGGDTWHRSSGSPATGGTWTFSWNGNSSNAIYWGVDLGWFSGGSFARPIFSQDNPLSTGTVGSCSFADDGTTFLNASTTSFNIVDGFEFTGNCQSGSGVGSIINPISATSFTTERLYIHGWTSTAGVGDDAGVKIGNNSNSTSNTSNRHLFDVIDGADSTFGASCNATSCLGTGHASGWAFGDGYDIEYSVIRHVSNGIQAGNVCTLIGNLMEYEFEPSLPGGRHGNVVEANFGSACTTMLAYNNVTRNTNTGVNWWLLGGTYYIFNDVRINSGHLFGSPPVDPNGLMLSGLGTTGFTVVHANLYNNTFQSNKVQAPVESGTTPGWAGGSTIVWENNHIMDFTSTPSFFTCGAGNTCTATENGGEVFQTTAAANTQGYTFANIWSPTASGNATVAAGKNVTSFCNGLPNSAAIAACKSGTPQAVVELAAWGGKIASYPSITVNKRATTAWDAGAYQFGSTGGTLCGTAPYPLARCDLNQVVFPSVPPQVGPNTCSAGVLNTCGQLTGHGRCIVDPNFVNTEVCRMTDATTGYPTKRFQTQATTESGSGDENLFNCNSTKMISDDSGSRTFPQNFWGFWNTRMYPNDASWVASNGFFVNTLSFWGHNCSTPNRMYNLGNGLAGTSGATGSILGYWDFTNQTTVPSFVSLFDFKSSSACLGGSYTVTWTTNGGSDQLDNDFAFGFSNGGGQGTGLQVAVWRKGSGCRVLNISTGTITGDWGPTGALTGTTCFGGIFLHNVKMFKQAGVLLYDFAGTPPAQCSDTGAGHVYMWQYTGLSVSPICPTGSQCGGHFTEGLTHFVNNTGNLAPNYWDIRSYTAPTSPTGIIPATPTGGIQPTLDFHCGWNWLNDLEPFGCETIVLGVTPNTAWSSEILAINPAGGQNPYRFANDYATGANSDFTTQEAVGSASQDGHYISFTSDWLNTLGGFIGTGGTGTSTCTPGNSGTCRGDVFVALLSPGFTRSLLFGSSWNHIPPSVWPPSDSHGTTASVTSFRIWDDGQKWGQIETSAGTYVWTGMDTIINTLVTNPFMQVIYVAGDTPKWAGTCSAAADPSACLPGSVGGGFGGGTQCASPSDYSCLPPSDVNSDGTGTDAQYQAFINTLTTRYPNQIAYYENWNEQDSPNFWCPGANGATGCPTTTQQAFNIAVRMNWDQWNIVHCNSPNSLVLSPSFHGNTALTWMHTYATTSISAPSGSIGACSWAAQTVTGAMTFDVTNFHFHNVSPDSAFNATYSNVATEISNDNLSASLVNDETGCSGAPQCINQDTEASWYARNYIVMASAGPPFIMIANQYQWDSGGGSGLEGTISGLAYDVVAGWLTGATQSSCAIAGNKWTCPGINSMGTAYLIAWDDSQNCTSGCTTANQSFGSQYGTWTDIAGVVHSTTGGNGTAPVGLKPILLLPAGIPPPPPNTLTVNREGILQ